MKIKGYKYKFSVGDLVRCKAEYEHLNLVMKSDVVAKIIEFVSENNVIKARCEILESPRCPDKVGKVYKIRRHYLEPVTAKYENDIGVVETSINRESD